MKLESLDATNLGSLVNTKQVSPIEVIEYFANLIEEKNKCLNAFTYLKIDEALDEAKELEKRINRGEYVGPFAGVPVGLKDFLPTKKGWTNSHGGVKSLIQVDDCDSIFYEAAKNLGAIAIGKTNAPAFGFRGTTDNKLYGPTRNPYNLAYNSGGSSGGSASAVGSRMVPLAECGDAGGSARIPSAWCNCFAIKPSAGLVPSICRPDAWTATHPYCCGGPTSRSVRDSAILLDAMQAFNARDPLSVPLDKKDFKQRRSIEGLKICYTFDFDLYPRCDSEIETAIESTFDVLLDSGAACVEPVNFAFKHTLHEIEEAWLLGISIDDSITPETVQTLLEHPEDVPEEFLYWHNRAKSATMLDYRKFHEIRTDILDAHLDVFDKYDIILAPVTGCMPVKNSDDSNTLGPQTIGGQAVDRLIGFGYTYLENMVGTPAASVPIKLGKNNLPIGLQVIGRRYFDEVVFSVAYALEEVNPWAPYYEAIKC